VSAEPIISDEYKYGFSQPENYVFKSRKGLDHEIVEQIAELKGEPQWMRDFRHRSLDLFLQRPMPNWGGNLGDIDFQDIYYYVKPTQEAGKTWEDVPEDIRDTFEKLGIPEAERKFLAGVGSQYESEVVYHKVREDLEKQGVIFVDPDTAFREYEHIFRPYFATVIPPNDNKFAALNSAVFSGGSFIYVPKGVSIDLPLQAYFRINAQNMGQFERTLIIADEGSYVHYVEGCFTAGARVRTRDGEKLIEEIREGDEVFTHKGRYRKVTHTMERAYQGDIYHIALAEQTLHVTEEHPLLIVRNPANRSKDEQPLLEWAFASQVKTGDYLVAPSEHAATIQVAPQDFWRADDRFTYLPVQSITTEQMDTPVYNLSVDEDETYVAEGVISHNCTAPSYTTDSLHSAVVEIIVRPGARVRYTTIQNWS
jgi:Fe-S cluster assembly scaffold protein SufB